MSKIYKAYVYEQQGEFHGKYFLGELEGINIRTNIVELADIPIEFCADSKKELLAEMVKFLKGTGHTGVLRVVNNAPSFNYNAPYNSQFLGAQPARAGEDY